MLLRMAQLSRAIQVSGLHSAYGMAIGSLIDTALPAYTDAADVQTLLFETAVQVGLNGVAVSLMGPELRGNDPTFGIPFSFALYAAQEGLGLRVTALGRLLQSEARKALLRMVPIGTEVGSSN
jgi:hypothetical protein